MLAPMRDGAMDKAEGIVRGLMRGLAGKADCMSANTSVFPLVKYDPAIRQNERVCDWHSRAGEHGGRDKSRHRRQNVSGPCGLTVFRVLTSPSLCALQS